MREDYAYNNIDEVMMAICACNAEAAKSALLGFGMGPFWRSHVRMLREEFSISKRAKKMLERDPCEFLRQPQDHF